MSIVLVNAVGDLNIVETSQSFTKDADTTFTVQLTIENKGTTVLKDISIVQKGDNFGNIVLTFPVKFDLDAGSSATKSVNVVVGSNVVPATYTGTLEAKTENNSHSDTTGLVISVNPTSALTTRDTPIVLTGNPGDTTPNKTFIVKNSGNTRIDNINLTYNQETFTDNDGNKAVLTFSKADFSLNAGQETTVDVFAVINEDLFLGSYVGPIKVGNAVTSTTFTLTTKVESDLLGISIDNRDPDDELAPGEEINFDITFDNIGVLDLENLKATLRITNIDDGKDLKEITQEFDLDSGDDTDKSFTLTIPLNVDEDDFDVTLTVNGRDEDGDSVHVVQVFENEVTIEKDENDRAQFEDVTISPEPASCGVNIDIDAIVINTGSSKQDDMYLELTIPELDITQKSSNFDLDSEDFDDRVKEVSFRVLIPKDAEKGVYELKITAKDEGEDFLGSKTSSFTIESGCSTPDSEEPPQDTLEIKDTSLEGVAGESISIPVKITNTGDSKETFTLDVKEYSIFATLVSIDQPTKNLGSKESSTGFVTLLLGSEVKGTYSFSITVEDSVGNVIEKKTLVLLVDEGVVRGVPPTGFTTFIDRLGGSGWTTTLIILGDILLLVIIVFFIRLIMKKR